MRQCVRGEGVCVNNRIVVCVIRVGMSVMSVKLEFVLEFQPRIPHHVIIMESVWITTIVPVILVIPVKIVPFGPVTAFHTLPQMSVTEMDNVPH